MTNQQAKKCPHQGELDAGNTFNHPQDLQQHANNKHVEVNHSPVGQSTTPAFELMQPYVDSGDELILLKGKKPVATNWTHIAIDSASVLHQAKQKGLNVGVRLSASDLIIDVDPRNYPAGRDSLAELVKDLRLDLSKTPCVHTGGGGFHYYLTKPEGLSIVGSLEMYPGIDFKTLGGQVVAAGSIHPDTGKLYQPAPTFGLRRPKAPEALRKLLERSTKRPEGAKHERWGELSPSGLEKTLEQLDVEGFNENGKWFDLMCACHHATAGEGREEFLAWSAGDAEYSDCYEINARRWDSLHDTSRGGKPVTIAYLFEVMKQHNGVVVEDDDFDDFDPVDGAEPGALRWPILSRAEMKALPPPKWLIPGLLPEAGLVAIYGAPSSGKSFLALDIAMAIASDTHWHGRKVVAGNVLYIAAEGSAGFNPRVDAWEAEYVDSLPVEPFRLMKSALNLSTEKEAKAFADEIVLQFETLGPLKLVVIDTLNQTAAGADENSAKDMGLYIASMKRLLDKTGATVIVVHHSGKDSAKGMRGSTALLGAMDTTIEVVRNANNGPITVAVKKQKDAEAEGPSRFSLDKVGTSAVLRPSVMAVDMPVFDEPNPIVALACQLALEHGERFPLTALVDAVMAMTGRKPSTVRADIDKAIPQNKEKALETIDGPSVWRERKGNNPKGAMEICVELKNSLSD